MAVYTSGVYNTKKEVVDDVISIGQAIIDNAEEIVGDNWGRLNKIEIIGTISPVEVPNIKWNKTMMIDAR